MAAEQARIDRLLDMQAMEGGLDESVGPLVADPGGAVEANAIGASDMDLSEAFDLETEIAKLLGSGDRQPGVPHVEQPEMAELLGIGDLQPEVPGVETVDLVTQAEMGATQAASAVQIASHLAGMQGTESVKTAETEAAERVAVEEEAQRVTSMFKSAPMAVTRPEISEFANPPEHPPHLGDGDPAAVQVPADGRCLYHCAVACRNLRDWVSTHDPNTGLATDTVMRKHDESSSLEVRDAIMNVAAELGERQVADRLKKSGLAGYPGQEELPFLSTVLGGQIILQSGPAQEVIGTGPLVAHIGFVLSTDGAGHASGHFIVHQSWLPVRRAQKRPSDGPGVAQASIGVGGKVPRLYAGAEDHVGGGSGSVTGGDVLDVRAGAASSDRAGATGAASPAAGTVGGGVVCTAACSLLCVGDAGGQHIRRTRSAPRRIPLCARRCTRLPR